MKKISIYNYRTKANEKHSLVAEILDNGDLVLSGYDSGQSVKEFYGDFDNEFWLTVKAENVPLVLLYLIKERFKDTTELKKWLEKKDIEYNFNSYT